MTTDARSLPHPLTARELLAGALIALVSVSFAMAVGNPGGFRLAIPIVGLAGFVSVVVLSQTYAGYLVMASAGFMLFCVAVTPDRYLNPFDAILPFMFPFAYYGALKRNAEDEARRFEVGPGHEAIGAATHQFAKAVAIFFGLAALSVGPMYFRVGPFPAMNSAFSIVRNVEALMLFPLGLWWVRSQRRLDQLANAVLIGGLLFVMVGIGQRLFLHVPRAGISWILNQPGSPTEDPNSAGLAMVPLLAVTMALHSMRPRWVTYAFVVVTIVGLILSQSRSGMMAMVTFLFLNMRGARVRHFLIAILIIAVAVLLVPEDFRTRMIKSFTFKRGSFELFTLMTRVLAYIALVNAFLHSWLIGYGYLSSTYICPLYNSFKISLPAENFFLEVAVGMGVIGLVAVTVCFVRLFRLGKVVGEHAPPGSFAHALSRQHVPLLAGIMTACMTGDILVGLVALAQLTVWCVLLVRAGHLAIRTDHDRATES